MVRYEFSEKSNTHSKLVTFSALLVMAVTFCPPMLVNRVGGAGAARAGPFWPNWSWSQSCDKAMALDQAGKIAFLTVESIKKVCRNFIM